MSRRAVKAINWAAIAERIPESEKNMLAAFKAKSDQYLRRMMANPETAPKIDWSYYKKNIASSSLVEKFQKEYEALKIPYPADKYTSQIEAQEKEMKKQIDDFTAKLDQQIVECQKEIDKVNALLPVAEMTMEDARDMYPKTFFNPEAPTMWPHHPDMPPVEEPEEEKKS